MLGIVQTNCYFVYKEGSSDVIFFDPADKGDYIYETLKEKGFNVAGILLTHVSFIRESKKRGRDKERRPGCHKGEGVLPEVRHDLP